MEEIIQLVSQVGFPIAVSAYLLFQNKQEAERHNKEVSALTEALNGNTVVLEKILLKLGE